MKARPSGFWRAERFALNKCTHQDSSSSLQASKGSTSAGKVDCRSQSTIVNRAGDKCEFNGPPLALTMLSQTERQTLERNADTVDNGKTSSLPHLLRQRRSKKPHSQDSEPMAAPSDCNRSQSSANEQPVPTPDPRGSAIIESAIRQSYTEFRLNGKELRISYSRAERHPLTLAVSHGTVKLSLITTSCAEKLHRARDILLAHLPVEIQSTPAKADVNLLKRLSERTFAPIAANSFVGGAATCETRAQVSNDEGRLWRFLLSLALLAASGHDPDGVRYNMPRSDFDCSKADNM